MTAKVIDLFAFTMSKEQVHPARLTAKQIAFRREYYGDKWANFERDQTELDQMAEWISEQYEAEYHESPEVDKI
jgi:hypothetical protein